MKLGKSVLCWQKNEKVDIQLLHLFDVQFNVFPVISVDCKLRNWSDWSTCSVSCGYGVQSHSRTPDPPASCGGADCVGEVNQTKPCYVECCMSLFVYLFVCLFVYLFICLFVYLFICLFVYLLFFGFFLVFGITRTLILNENVVW